MSEGLPSASFHGVVIPVATVVCVKELLEPLEELKVVLELLFGQLVHIDCLRGRKYQDVNILISKLNLVHIHFLESRLQ